MTNTPKPQANKTIDEKRHKPESLGEATRELRLSFRVLVFEIAKATGILWLVGRITFLDYKEWVKAQLEKENK